MNDDDFTAALRLNHLFDLDMARYGHVAAWNRQAFGLPGTAAGNEEEDNPCGCIRG